MSEPVTLRMAYEWTCPECGTDHFARAIVAEMSMEEREELRFDHGVDESETGDWVVIPETVECPDCHREFETRHFFDD